MPSVDRHLLTDLLRQTVERLEPGARLPSVRSLMREHGVSQATVERSLDELVRQGLVRREARRGLFVEGRQPQGEVVGVCTNDLATVASNVAFLRGVRARLATSGLSAADFGPRSVWELRDQLLDSVGRMGFAGLIVDLSTRTAMHLEGDDPLLRRLRDLKLPIVTTRALPALAADSVSTDDFDVFRRLGEHLACRAVAQPIHFLGRQGLPTLARLYGLAAGLGERVELDSQVLSPARGGVTKRITSLMRSRRPGTLVLGVPLASDKDLSLLRDGPWRADSARQLAVTLDEGQELPAGVSAHIITKPGGDLGRAAAELITQRVMRPAAAPRHELVRHHLYLAD